MCGIVGLFLNNKELEPEFGRHLAAMLTVMSDRGPDSAGFAVYGGGSAGALKLTVRAPHGYPWESFKKNHLKAYGPDVELHVNGTHAVMKFDASKEAAMRGTLMRLAPDVSIVGAGHSMEVYKEAGHPSEVARRFKLGAMQGTHGIGHTRMATESAVTTKGAHPFASGPDQCLVHNGSLSNHNSVRRQLAQRGYEFETENDSEVAAVFLTAQMEEGKNLGEALESCLGELDGFYTFVVGTASGFGVLRDPIACKPAVMAETESYVAFGSEYRALDVLPGIASARLWEPEPGKVYFWERRP
jgi:glutamate synthase domain-containing protein 1